MKPEAERLVQVLRQIGVAALTVAVALLATLDFVRDEVLAGLCLGAFYFFLIGAIIVLCYAVFVRSYATDRRPAPDPW